MFVKGRTEILNYRPKAALAAALWLKGNYIAATLHFHTVFCGMCTECVGYVLAASEPLGWSGGLERW